MEMTIDYFCVGLLTILSILCTENVMHMF